MLVRLPLACSLSATDALRCLRGERLPFALVGAWAGGGAVLGCDPVRVAEPGDDPFALLEAAGQVEGEPPPGFVGGGWVGYLGYELRHRIEACHPSPFDAAPAAPFALAYYDDVLRLDRDGRWWFEALASDGADERRARLEALLAVPPAPAPVATRGWRLVPGPHAHAGLVAACRERIHAGDLFQANVCARLEGELDGSALELFARAVDVLEPDRAAYLEGPWGAVASLSPELFLERHGRRVRTAPIKGTRPRTDAARRELASSAKDRAENTMIVDLMRNDLGRVCEPGSVAVTALAEVRPHTGVWHLVSEVEGRLGAGVGDGALLRATFPPGSVTGAPKVAAMDVISELESAPRGVYTGAIGFASPVAGLELSVVIRTIEVRGSRVVLGVGGGVVADSDPAAEAEELAVKAAPLLAAIGATPPASGRGHARRAPVLRAGPRPVPRPDPAAGVFGTLLVRDGRAAALDAQLARLTASARALYGLEPPPDAAEQIAAAARDWGGPARLRADLGADGAFALSGGPLPETSPVGLRAWTLPGGLGEHKWADRRLMLALEAASEGAMPLLADADGLVLEASRANVLVLGADGVLRTPPADGRILPGIARGEALEAGAVEAEITLAELADARGVWIVNALRGAVPVRALDGEPLPVAALV